MIYGCDKKGFIIPFNVPPVLSSEIILFGVSTASLSMSEGSLSKGQKYFLARVNSEKVSISLIYPEKAL